MKRFLVITLISALASSYLTSHASNEIDSLITVLDENLQPTQKILVLSKLMDHYQVLGFDKSFQYANQLRDLVNEFGNVVDKAKVKHSFGDIYLLDGQVDLALVNYLSSIKFYKKAGLISETAHVLTDIAYIFYKVQEYSKAKEYYLDALALYEQNGLKKEIIKTSYNLSTCFRQKKNYSEALKYTYKALKLAEKINDQVSINKIYNHIGIIHFKKGDYKLARENYLRSIKNVNEEEDKTLRLAYGYNNIGESYRDERNFSLAHQYFKKALIEKLKLNKPAAIATTLLNIGKLYLMENQPDSAIVYLEKTLSLIDLSTAYFDSNLKETPSILITAYQRKKTLIKRTMKDFWSSIANILNTSNTLKPITINDYSIWQ